MNLIKVNRGNVIDTDAKATLNGQTYKITVLKDILNNIEFPTEYSRNGSTPWKFDWSRILDAYLDDDFYCVVSEGTLIAIFCLLDYRKREPSNSGDSYLHLFEVNPDYRRQGYGQKSLLMLEEYLKNREGINHIALEPIDPESCFFYRLCGYEWGDGTDRMHKQLV